MHLVPKAGTLPMLLSIHLGLHMTESDQLMSSLRKCSRLFAREGIALPEPKLYRALLADTVRKLKGAQASEETQEYLLDAFLVDEEPTRAILSYEDFICHPTDVFFEGAFYSKAPFKAMWLRNAFASQEVEFHISVRNPATFIPALAGSSRHQRTYEQILNGADIMGLRWSKVIQDIRTATPDCPINVWAYEDTPLIWPEVLREISGLPPMAGVRGGFDVVKKIMHPEGMDRLRKYLKEHKDQTEIQRRRVIAAFLDKYAIEDAIEAVIDLPGWTNEMIDEMTETYEEDLYAIARIPGVAMITP